MPRTWTNTVMAIAIAAIAPGCDASVDDRDGAGGQAAAGGHAAGAGATDGGGGTCGSPLCPPAPPAQGQPCGPCFEGLVCNYGDCSTGSEALVTARCERVWQRTTLETCPPLCGDEPCGPGEVCLEESTGFAVSHRCVADPCAGDTLDCACAAVLCEAPLECTAAGDGEVTCFCACD
jgi:hypothetical protein